MKKSFYTSWNSAKKKVKKAAKKYDPSRYRETSQAHHEEETREDVRANARKQLVQRGVVRLAEASSSHAFPALLRVLSVDLRGGDTARAADIEKAYKKALVQYHPDRNRSKGVENEVLAEETFKLLRAAHTNWQKYTPRDKSPCAPRFPAQSALRKLPSHLAACGYYATTSLRGAPGSKRTWSRALAASAGGERAALELKQRFFHLKEVRGLDAWVLPRSMYRTHGCYPESQERALEKAVQSAARASLRQQFDQYRANPAPHRLDSMLAIDPTALEGWGSMVLKASELQLPESADDDSW
eukprot:gene16315-19362_t